MDKLKFKLKTLETIDKMFDEMEKMEKKKDQLNDKMKQEFEAQKAAMNEKKAEMKKRIDKIEDAAENNMGEVQEVLSESMKHYQAGFTEMSKLFK